MNRLPLVLLAWLCIPVCGYAQTATVAPPLATASPLRMQPSYRISTGDVLDISVVSKPELNKVITVLSDGSISYPYLGEFPVEGMTLRQLNSKLVEGLEKQIYKPQVLISVVKRGLKEVSVLGAVRSPGKRELGEEWHLLNLLADAGGLSVERPEWVSATLVRQGGEDAIAVDMMRLYATADSSVNVALRPGDVLLVQEVDKSRILVQVLGEVRTPGTMPAPRDGSIVSVLTAAGGPTERAALSKVVLRKHTGESIQVDLGSLKTDGKIADITKIEPGDTLIVPKNQQQFAVLGAVGQSGPQDYPENQKITVLSAIALAGGTAQNADLRQSSIIRPKPDGSNPEIIPLNLETMLKKKSSDTNNKTAQIAMADIPLLPGDVIFVPSKDVKTPFTLRSALSYLPFVGYFLR